MSVVVETEPEVLEEDVFPEEVVTSFLSPLQAESIDFPDTPVSFMHIINVRRHAAGSVQFLFFACGQINLSAFFIIMMPVPVVKWMLLQIQEMK